MLMPYKIALLSENGMGAPSVRKHRAPTQKKPQSLNSKLARQKPKPLHPNDPFVVIFNAIYSILVYSMVSYHKMGRRTSHAPGRERSKTPSVRPRFR